MQKPSILNLSRRERQIMEAIYSLGEATAGQIREQLPNPPTLNAVRTMLQNLEEKNLVSHRWDGPKYIYSPTIEKHQASKTAIQHLKETYFDGSTALAMVSLLDEAEELSDSELDVLADLIDEARKQN